MQQRRVLNTVMKGLEKKFYSLSKISIVFSTWKYLPVFGILLLDLIFFYPVIFQNKIPLPVDALVGAHVPWTEVKWEGFPAGVPIKNQEITDSISQFFPWRSLVGEFWRAGKPPLWNQYMLSGAPLLASWHSASLYPLNVIYLLFSDTNSWTILIFLQIFLSGVFMYIFLYHLNLSKLASFFGSIAFSFSGYMIAWLEFATGGHAGLWLPLLLFVELQLFETKQIKWLIFSSLVFFFIFTAGDFQVPFYITITYILFGLYLSFRKRSNISRFKNIGLLFSGLFFGLLLSLPQLLPTIELYLKSVRVADPYIKEYFYGIMHWEKIVNFIWPDFFGNVVTRNYWGKFGYHEYLSFVGTVTLAFVIFSFFRRKGRIENFFWILLFISLVFLFPTPFAFLPYKLSIPALGTSSASRIIVLVDFCLATLGAFGFNKFQETNDKNILKTFFCLLVISFGTVLGILVSIYQMTNSTLVPEMVKNLKVALRNMVPSTLVLLVLWIAFIFYINFPIKSKNKTLIKFIDKSFILLIILVTSFELLHFAWKNTPFSNREFVFPTTRIIEFLQKQQKPFRIAGGIPLNLFMPYQINSAEGYDPLYPARNSEWYSLVNSDSLDALSGRYGLIHRFDSKLIDQANVKYVIDYKKDANKNMSDTGAYEVGIDPEKYKEVYSEGRIKVFENLDVLPRIWITTIYTVAKDNKELMAKLVNKSNPGKHIVLEKKPDIVLEDKNVSYELTDFNQKMNKISFNVDVSDDALLFLSESFDQGWTLKIDNSSQEILRANYIFQATPITKGKHFIQFTYRTRSYYFGLIVSFMSVLFLAGFMTFRKRSSNRN